MFETACLNQHIYEEWAPGSALVRVYVPIHHKSWGYVNFEGDHNSERFCVVIAIDLQCS